MRVVIRSATIGNFAQLRPRKPGVQMLARAPRPRFRCSPFSALFWRNLFDRSAARYSMTLLPFPVAMLIRPDLALAISQAPLLMFALVYGVESQVLSVPTPEKRRNLIDPARAARGLDLLGARSRAALSQIAAGRDLHSGMLHLAVEQSTLARVEPLTLISVLHTDTDPAVRPALLDLTDEEAAFLDNALFDAEMDERLLQTINLSENTFVRVTEFDSRAVSAHARLMAMAARRG